MPEIWTMDIGSSFTVGVSCLFASQEEVNGQTVSLTVYSREQQEALHHRESARQAIDKLTTALAELSF